MDKITEILTTKFPENIRVGDQVTLKELPVFSHLNPSKSCGEFLIDYPHRRIYLTYPLNSKLFNYMPTPFNYKKPPIELLRAKYKILNDPYYKLSEPDYDRGVMYIYHKSVEIRNSPRLDPVLENQVIKTIKLEKEYSEFLPYDKEVKLLDNEFDGEVIHFIGYPDVINSEVVIHKVLDSYITYDLSVGSNYREGLLNRVDDIIVKIVNKFGIYIDIPLKLLKHA